MIMKYTMHAVLMKDQVSHCRLSILTRRRSKTYNFRTLSHCPLVKELTFSFICLREKLK